MKMERGSGGTAIRHAVSVNLPPEEAFARFVDDLDDWWPVDYTWSQGALEEIGIEARVGGKCFEIGPQEFRCDWGRVLEFEPPVRLVFTWQISPRREPVPDARRASEVEVRLQAERENATRVEIEHRGFERHGDGAEEYRAALSSEAGWPYILRGYAAVNG